MMKRLFFIALLVLSSGPAMVLLRSNVVSVVPCKNLRIEDGGM